MKQRKAKTEPAAPAAPTPPAVVLNGRGNPVQPSRIGRAMIGAYFPPAVQQELKILAIRERGTLGGLLYEAVNLLLAKRGLPSIEELESKESESK